MTTIIDFDAIERLRNEKNLNDRRRASQKYEEKKNAAATIHYVGKSVSYDFLLTKKGKDEDETMLNFDYRSKNSVGGEMTVKNRESHKNCIMKSSHSYDGFSEIKLLRGGRRHRNSCSNNNRDQCNKSDDDKIIGSTLLCIDSRKQKTIDKTEGGNNALTATASSSNDRKKRSTSLDLTRKIIKNMPIETDFFGPNNKKAVEKANQATVVHSTANNRMRKSRSFEDCARKPITTMEDNCSRHRRRSSFSRKTTLLWSALKQNKEYNSSAENGGSQNAVWASSTIAKKRLSPKTHSGSTELSEEWLRDMERFAKVVNKSIASSEKNSDIKELVRKRLQNSEYLRFQM